MDRIRNNKALCFLVALFLIIGLMPMTGTAFAAGSYQTDDSMGNQELTRISITADLHLLGNGDQNNRARFEAYLKGIQNFEPDLLILCGDQYEGLGSTPTEKKYVPPMEGDYSSESGIGLGFINPYDEIRAISSYYLGDIPVIFVRGNNDYNDGNDYDRYAGYPTGSAEHYGLIETSYVDVFRFGAPNGVDDEYNYSSDEIYALDDYLANRPDKSKLVLISGHYPIDDGEGTQTNQGGERNAANATSVSGILEKYDQPVVFLWGHNHDLGPVLAGEILKFYETGYQTLNSGAVGYKDTLDYAQGINMTLGSNGRMVDLEMTRYDLDGNASSLYFSDLEFPKAEIFAGSGSEGDPYLISSAENLRYLALMVNNGEDYSGQYFQQMDDLDLSGENWKPIGKYVSSDSPNDKRNRGFSGIYDGGGHIIANLTIEETLAEDSIISKGYGLFGYLTGTVRNLGLKNLDIKAEIAGDSNIYAGGIAGYMGYYNEWIKGFIENCFVEGSVYASAEKRCAAGGLAGYLKNGSIKNSYSATKVISGGGIENSGAGGLVGYVNSNGIIDKGYWNTELTTDFGKQIDAILIDADGKTTDEMKADGLIQQLNDNVDAMNPEIFLTWMSDQYTNLNNGYPIHEREVLLEPIIESDPADTSSLANGSTVQITISSIIPTSSIWYTVDGTNPEDSSTRIEYTTPFALSTTDTAGETKTIKAVTTNGNGTYSTVAVKLVKFLAVPTNPGGGSGGGSSGGGSGGSSAVTPIPEVKPPLEMLPMPDITDITGHWAESGIRKAFGLGFVNGYLDKTFRPERQITRAEFLTMLVKALGMTTPKAISWEDVDQHWAKEQIQVAAQNGIVEGLSGNLFGPDQAITREQMTVMLARAMKISTATQKSSFRDGKDISAWALNDIDAATQWKLIQGYEDSTFRPQGPATRAEAVEIIIRALTYQENLNKSVNGAQ